MSAGAYDYARNTGRYRGLVIPVTRKRGSYFAPQTDVEVIWSSILQIITTPIGSRYGRRDFGSRFPELLHNPNDSVLASLAFTYIKRDVEKWDDRVVIERTRTETDPNSKELRLTVVFRLKIDSQVHTRTTTMLRA